jgi:hypothetical protein
MDSKLFTTLISLAVLAALAPVSHADSGEVQPYNGMVGAGSPLYQIKIFIQHMDIYLTFNDTEKMVNQMDYLDERLSEAEAARLANNSDAMNASLDE